MIKENIHMHRHSNTPPCKYAYGFAIKEGESQGLFSR